jgi:MOSC domain-containing protein YiiM
VPGLDTSPHKRGDASPTPSSDLSSPARVHSVNVGAIRHVRWRGTTVATGIWKQPVGGRVAVKGTQLTGDHQADTTSHGGQSKAVYTYSVEDYGWWEGELGITLEPGTFGENLTLSGLDINQTLVGERWRIGSAVFQVTQPRTPCFKLGIRMGDNRFPRRFAMAGRAGTYLAIAEEGEVEAGDPIEVVHRPAHPVTIGLLAYLDYHDRPVRRLVENAAHIGLEPREWEELLGRLGVPIDSGYTSAPSG